MSNTGQSFKGEKALAVVSVVLGLVTTVILLRVLILQNTYFSNEIKKQNGDTPKTT